MPTSDLLQALALLAAIKKLYPRKALTQVVNTHPHFDHAGGLRTFVDAGATIITQANNKEFFERALNTPRTLLDDAGGSVPATASATLLERFSPSAAAHAYRSVYAEALSDG